MNFYDLAMSPIEFMFLNKMRKNIITQANGNVLEIGFGTGANVEIYQSPKIKSLTAIDIKFSKATLNKFKDKVRLIEAGAEDIPFKDNSFDTIVSTIALCSVEDLDQSIKEIRRVLKNGGQYLFVEHVLPENKYIARVFHKLNKPWSQHMGGCNINRETVTKLLEHGFILKEKHMKNLKVFTYGTVINNK